MALKNSHIVIAGAGMGGLASALSLAKEGFTRIDVYETASNLGFVGAGIQLAPNMARILDRLGCWKEIEAEATDITSTSIRQGDTDKELGFVDLEYIRKTYGYPHMVGHRSSLAGAMFKACQQEKAITFNFSQTVEAVDLSHPKPILRIKPRNGEAFTVEPDVLLAADSIKSIIRAQMLQDLHHDAMIQDTAQAAYRIMLKREWVADDAEILQYFDSDRVVRWIGEKRHIIAYPVSNKTIYNMSTVQPDTNFAAAPSATYTTKGSKADMLKTFSDFNPTVQRMLNLVPGDEVCEWKLRVHSPLPTWIHGCAALVGDACHPTLPHLAQGAAQAIEDGAVLAVVLANCPDTSPESINKSLKVYEKVRKERAETLVDIAAQSGRSLHLGEGAAKAERDRMFAALKEKKGSVPDKWADADVQKKIYGHDCAQEARDSFKKLFDEASAAP